MRSPYAVKETHPVPKRWLEIGPAPGEHKIILQIGLKQSRFDELEQHLYEGTFCSRAATITYLQYQCICFQVSDLMPK
jgi:tripeptidyl-peptidase-1